MRTNSVIGQVYWAGAKYAILLEHARVDYDAVESQQHLFSTFDLNNEHIDIYSWFNEHQTGATELDDNGPIDLKKIFCSADAQTFLW